MKQETIEEAAEKACPIFNRSTPFGSKYPWTPKKEREAFIKGALWKQERSYSEEEVLKLLISKEENTKDSIKYNGVEYITPEEWLKQFKKK